MTAYDEGPTREVDWGPDMDYCPEFLGLQEGFNDPITVAYGAGEVIADSIIRHMRSCDHPFCVEEWQNYAY